MPSTHEYAGIAASPIATKRNAEIVSFASALAFLHTEVANLSYGGDLEKAKRATWRAGDQVPLALRSPNLKLRVLRCDDSGQPTHIGVVLYNTVIVTYRNDETFTCNTGGYNTPTTMSRLNQFTPLPYRWRAHRGDRMMWLAGHWAENDANRFTVAEIGLVGEEVKAPTLKRNKAKSAHGTLRWLSDYEGHIMSVNDKYPGQVVYPELQYEKIGEGGNYNAPLQYELKRGKVGIVGTLRGSFGVAKADVPLDIVNEHRKVWGMPLIELVPAE